MAHINDLPLELLIEILKRTSGVTLARCRLVSKRFKECIDEVDSLWYYVCTKEFTYSSKIPKAAMDFTWHEMYKNLTMWSIITRAEKGIKDLYKFALRDEFDVYDLKENIMRMKDKGVIIVYDTAAVQYRPDGSAKRTYKTFRIVDNEPSAVGLLNIGLQVEKTRYEDLEPELFFSKTKKMLSTLFFFNNCNNIITSPTVKSVAPTLLLHSDYEIIEIENENRVIYSVNECSHVLDVDSNLQITIKPANYPEEWLKEIKHMCALDGQNYVSYSQSLFKIETAKYQHLYLEFPEITALFLYGDIVLIATKDSDVLLYHLNCPTPREKPIFEKVAKIPNHKYAEQLDVFERRSGLVIVAATSDEMFFIELNFFGNDELNGTTLRHRSRVSRRLLRLTDTKNPKAN